MNHNQFNKMFHNFSKGMSLGSIALFGLGYLALNSYYYGIIYTIQLMLDTTLSSLTNSPRFSHLRSTEKDIISKFLSSRLLSFTMYKLVKTKFLLKLLIVICKALSFQFVSFSTLRWVNFTLSMLVWDLTINKKCCLLYVTKYWEL